MTQTTPLALENAVKRLVDEKNGLIKLNPPFTGSAKRRGISRLTRPVFRENAPYTHAASGWHRSAARGMADKGTGC